MDAQMNPDQRELTARGGREELRDGSIKCSKQTELFLFFKVPLAESRWLL